MHSASNAECSRLLVSPAKLCPLSCPLSSSPPSPPAWNASRALTHPSSTPLISWTKWHTTHLRTRYTLLHRSLPVRHGPDWESENGGGRESTAVAARAQRMGSRCVLGRCGLGTCMRSLDRHAAARSGKKHAPATIHCRHGSYPLSQPTPPLPIVLVASPSPFPRPFRRILAADVQRDAEFGSLRIIPHSIPSP
ncbi:hypothetical protein B0H19DRAFT_1250686 [Mycena capillaripes]|nr:hypothetical protein B0H19DRAFT_1250686 [Mycena capillaripes]